MMHDMFEGAKHFSWKAISERSAKPPSIPEVRDVLDDTHFENTIDVDAMGGERPEGYDSIIHGRDNDDSWADVF